MEHAHPGPYCVHIQKDGGNWEYQIRTVKPHNPGSADGMGKHIATVNHHPTMNPAETAALLAASHDLLAACKAFQHEMRGPTGIVVPRAIRMLLEAAVLKAEGGAA